MKATIENELEKLKLKMNPKSTIYCCSSATGMPFLGYRYCIFGGGLRIFCLAKTVRRIRTRLKILARHDAEKYERSRASYHGYFMQATPNIVL